MGMAHKERGVTYHNPTVGPRLYMARGSSGWVESFQRSDADKQLAAYLGHVTLKIAVDGFRSRLKRTQHSCDWHEILDYLSHITSKSANLVPDVVGVAFWCQYVLSEREGQGVN